VVTIAVTISRMRFPIRIHDDDQVLWTQVQEKASQERMSINTIILKLLAAWVAGKVKIGATRAA
jgi:hypothetical protein